MATIATTNHENAVKNTGKACPGLDPGMPALPAFSNALSQK